MSYTLDDLVGKKKDGIVEIASDLGIEYTTKTETIVKIAKELSGKKSGPKGDRWDKDFQKAATTALKNAIRNDRSYDVFEVNREESEFNVRPSYMKHPKDSNPLLTVVRYRNG